MWRTTNFCLAAVSKKKSSAPVASFCKEYIDMHPTFTQLKMDKRLARLNEAWSKLPATKKDFYLKNPLKGLQPPAKKA